MSDAKLSNVFPFDTALVEQLARRLGQDAPKEFAVDDARSGFGVKKSFPPSFGKQGIPEDRVPVSLATARPDGD